MNALASLCHEGSQQALDCVMDQCRALIGRRLADRFEVGQVLGYGGSSIIFEGWHLVLRHPVAVKVLRADYAVDSELVGHFAQEAMVTAQMRSPHVVRVFDTGLIDDKVPYTVLELLRGQTLNELRRNGRTFSPEEAVDLVLQACRALDESHGRGIIHRDIKPDNLFLAELPDGTHVLKVIDFGVAKHGVSHTFFERSLGGYTRVHGPRADHVTKRGRRTRRHLGTRYRVVRAVDGSFAFSRYELGGAHGFNRSGRSATFEVAYQGLPFEVYEAVASCLAKNPEQRFRYIKDLAAKLVRARERFNRGEELSTGIVRLPDNWDLRLTPHHGWSIPGPTIALKPPVAAGAAALRRRLSMGAGLVAGALFGIGIANYVLHPGGAQPVSTSTVVVSNDAMPAAALLVPAPVEPVVATATSENETKPRAEPPLSLVSTMQLMPPSPNTPLPVQVERYASVAKSSTLPNSPNPGGTRAITAPAVVPRAPVVATNANLGADTEELLTPWTGRKR